MRISIDFKVQREQQNYDQDGQEGNGDRVVGKVGGRGHERHFWQRTHIFNG